MTKKELPSSLFQVGSSLLPRIVEVFNKTQLSPTELFVLSYIKYFGTDYNGQRIFLGKQMRDMLKELFHFSASKATKEISRLEERGFLAWLRLSSDQKQEIYGDRGGKKFALVLLESGSSKIVEFNNEINLIYFETTSRIPAVIVTPFLRAIGAITKEMLNHQLRTDNKS
jgi:DNA-binding MarR family transcriptional regulator